MTQISRHFPGAVFCVAFSGLLYVLAQAVALPIMILALCFGMLFFKAFDVNALKPGIEFCAQTILYIGVALLGLNLDISDIYGASGATIGVSLLTLIVTLIGGFLICRMLKLNREFSLLISGAVAICGVSAAAAICCALPACQHRQKELAITVAGITILSSLAMLVYPAISFALDLTDFSAGTFFGATIHNVSQVVGAGYSVSNESGDIATLVKMIRVSALLPVIIGITWVFRVKRSAENKLSWRTYFPVFLIVFFVLAAANSLHVFPEQVSENAGLVAKACLVISLFAIGLKTNLFELAAVSKKPLIAMSLTTAFMAVIGIVAILVLQSGFGQSGSGLPI